MKRRLGLETDRCCVDSCRIILLATLCDCTCFYSKQRLANTLAKFLEPAGSLLWTLQILDFHSNLHNTIHTKIVVVASGKSANLDLFVARFVAPEESDCGVLESCIWDFYNICSHSWHENRFHKPIISVWRGAVYQILNFANFLPRMKLELWTTKMQLNQFCGRLLRFAHVEFFWRTKLQRHLLASTQLLTVNSKEKRQSS